MAVTKSVSPGDRREGNGSASESSRSAGARRLASRGDLSQSFLLTLQGHETERDSAKDGWGGGSFAVGGAVQRRVESGVQKRATADRNDEKEDEKKKKFAKDRLAMRATRAEELNAGGCRSRAKEAGGDFLLSSQARDESILVEALRFARSVRDTWCAEEKNKIKDSSSSSSSSAPCRLHPPSRAVLHEQPDDHDRLPDVTREVKTLQIFLSLVDVKAAVEEIQQARRGGGFSSHRTDRLCYEVLHAVEAARRAFLEVFPVHSSKLFSTLSPVAEEAERKGEPALRRSLPEEEGRTRYRRDVPEESPGRLSGQRDVPWRDLENPEKDAHVVGGNAGGVRKAVSVCTLVSDEMIQAWAQEVSTTDDDDDDESEEAGKRASSSIMRRKRRGRSESDAAGGRESRRADVDNQEGPTEDTQGEDRGLENKETRVVEGLGGEAQNDRNTVVKEKEEGEERGKSGTGAIEMVSLGHPAEGSSSSSQPAMPLSTRDERQELLSFPGSSSKQSTTRHMGGNLNVSSHNLRRRRSKWTTRPSGGVVGGAGSSTSPGMPSASGREGEFEEDQKNLEQELLDYAQEMKEEAKRYGDVIQKDCDRLGRTGTLQQTHIDQTRSAARDTKSLIFSGGFGFFYAMLLLLVGCVLLVLMITFILFVPG